MSQPEERADPDERAWMRAAAEQRAADAALEERVEVERAAGHWRDRLVGSVGQAVVLRTTDGSVHEGALSDTGRGWALLRGGGRSKLVMLDEVVTAVAPSTAVVGAAARARRGPGWVYRRWARLSVVVMVCLRDGSQLSGPVEEVLSDALTLRLRTEHVTVPFTGVRWAIGETLPEG